MKQPTQRAVFFFFGCLIMGYALLIPLLPAWQIPLGLNTLANLTIILLPVALLLLILFDKPLNLGLINWSARPAQVDKPATPLPPPQPIEASFSPAQPEPQEATGGQILKIPLGSMFPHEPPSEHWEADFSDSKQVYQGTDLPVWILAGWAVFIVWAVIYLLSGLPTFTW